MLTIENRDVVIKEQSVREIEAIQNLQATFSIGSRVVAKRHGPGWTPANVLHIRNSENGFEYLVHYEGCNRRLDEWLPAYKVRPVSLYEKESDKSLNMLKSTKDISVRENEISKQSDSDENDESEESYHCVSNNTITAMLSPNDQPIDENIIHDDSTHSFDLPVKLTRNKKRKYDEINHVSMSYHDMDPTTAALEREYLERTNIKFIDRVIFGKYELDTWYFSPYPEVYGQAKNLFVCEFCMKYMRFTKTYLNHLAECSHRHPPGEIIYQQGDLTVFEVDGNCNKLYCQNLCLMAKMFLDHKTLYFDVSPFMFYILTEKDDDRFHLLGYFSKEKISEITNLSCLLVMPPYQRCGYGKFLISLSYELSKRERVVRSPEKPLSDLGKLTYRSYWCWVILNYLRDNIYSSHTINDLSLATGISPDDIIYTLQVLSLLKYWKGQRVVCFSPKVIDEYLHSGNCKPPKLTVNPDLLNWPTTKLDTNNVFSDNKNKGNLEKKFL